MRIRPEVGAASSVSRPIPRQLSRSYDQVVMSLTSRVMAVPHGLAARFAALPARRQEQLQDLGLAVALSAVNAVSLLSYRTWLHPLWLALLLVVAQGMPLIWRRARPVGSGLVIGAARIAYDRIGFAFAPLPLGPAIAVYTVVDRRGPAMRWLTFVLVAAGITISSAGRGHTEPYDAIFQALIFITAWVAGTVSRAKRASLQAAQGRADRAEAELDRQSARAAAAERTRIARELHDVVAHHVSLIAVQAEAAAALLPERPGAARGCVDVIGDTARQALTELRRLLGVLRGPAELPDTAPAASLRDLEALLAQVRGAGLPVDFIVTGTPGTLAPGIELTAFRIVQEALTNTLRHADATQATVTVSYEPGFVTLVIADSGPHRAALAPAGAGGAVSGVRSRSGSGPGGSGSGGFALGGSGLGLAGIAERVAACGGNLTVGPTPSAGFALTARLPAL
jgi:signal transduction histidine kinase